MGVPSISVNERIRRVKVTINQRAEEFHERHVGFQREKLVGLLRGEIEGQFVVFPHLEDIFLHDHDVGITVVITAENEKKREAHSYNSRESGKEVDTGQRTRENRHE